MKDIVKNASESSRFAISSNPQSAIAMAGGATTRKSSIVNSVDAIQAAIERLPQVELPLTHRFAPGMYIRTIFMPKGALVISKIHRTQHPFVVTKGRCIVYQNSDREGTGPQQASAAATEIKAGHIGITMPGTRRILYIYEDTEWTTFHATNKTTPEEVEADIIEPHEFDRQAALDLFAGGAVERLNAKEAVI